jgi:prophage regulatory protein
MSDHDLEPAVYVADRDLAERFKTSRATIWRWVEKRGFPAPVRLSPGCSRWRMDQVRQWEAGRR